MSDRANQSSARTPLVSKLQDWLNLTAVATLVALALSLYNFYRSYLYVNQQLDVTVTEVSYSTNLGELYLIVALSNPGNRDAAVLRVEPALWVTTKEGKSEFAALSTQVSPEIPVTDPKTPTVVRAGGVELIRLSTRLDAQTAEHARDASKGGAFIGIRLATMNADGNLFLLQHAVARLVIDKNGHIQKAEPTIHRSLPGFSDDLGPPPGDMLQPNRKTPFVWADEHYAS